MYRIGLIGLLAAVVIVGTTVFAIPRVEGQGQESHELARAYVALLNSGGIDGLEEIVAPDIAHKGELPGIDALRQRLIDGAQERDAAFAEWRFIEETIIAEDRAVAAHLLFTATTHAGNEIEIDIMWFWDVADGRLARGVMVADEMAMIEQMWDT